MGKIETNVELVVMKVDYRDLNLFIGTHSVIQFTKYMHFHKFGVLLELFNNTNKILLLKLRVLQMY